MGRFLAWEGVLGVVVGGGGFIRRFFEDSWVGWGRILAGFLLLGGGVCIKSNYEDS